MKSAKECMHLLPGVFFVLFVLAFGFNRPLAANEMWEELFNDHLANAKAGAADAQYEVGIMYLKGQGVAQDREKALEWLKKSSAAGYQLATSKLSRIDEQESKFEQLQNEAKAGNLDAQYELGMMYLKGRGIEADDSKARQWLQRAADKGDSKAITRLGILSYKGEGGTTNYAQALSLFKRVSGDSVLAQYYLGEMYASGAGVEKDYKVAIDWYTKAADGGFNRARGKIINLEEEMKMASRRQSSVARVETPQPEAKAEPETPKVATAAVAPVAAKPAPAAPVRKSPPKIAAPKPVLSGFDKLEAKKWVRGKRPVDYLPSQVTECDRDDDKLVCFSKVLTRLTGTQTVEYRVKSIIRSDNDTFTVTYRNLVLDVTNPQEPEDQPLGYDDQTEQGFRIQTGWTPAHVVSCEQPSNDSMSCIKDETHKMTLAAEGSKLAAGGAD
jgi:hypothetical protein